MSVVRVALGVPSDRAFDYWLPDSVGAPPGTMVRVRLGARRAVGVIVERRPGASDERESLRSVDDLVDLPPIPEDVLALAHFVSGYYREPLGLAVALALPPVGASGARPRAKPLPARVAATPAGRAALADLPARAAASLALRERLRTAGDGGLDVAALGDADRRRIALWWRSAWVGVPIGEAGDRRFEPNDAQRRAIEAIAAAAGGYAPLLLRGVTGSGKTDVYAEVARRAIEPGGQVLLLVPEINLTPQLTARFQAALIGRAIVTLHSALPDGERRANWLAAANGDAALVVGTRLAVFAPLPRLALVIVDEEHDPSYKQQDGVRYHARDAAVWRARERGVPIVLGSATPALETLEQCRRGRYRRLDLPSRADARAAPPVVRLVAPDDAEAHDGMSGPLWRALALRLERREQALVFVNRRGYAPSLKCPSCSWEAGCPRCSARLVLHRDPPRLRCHHCGHAERVPGSCPECGNVDLHARGHGTQRLERALAQAFPSARIARIDRDTTRSRSAFDEVRRRVATDAVDILVGTQMLAKGHDFPRLTLVGVLGADNALYSADFRATERLGALLFQVAGRAGRAALPGEVVVQTAFPMHPVYAALVADDYDSLAARLADERRLARLPPYSHLALLGAEARARADVEAFLNDAHRAALSAVGSGDDIVVHDPVPTLLARRADRERGQLTVQSSRRDRLSAFLDVWLPSLRALAARRVRWAVDVDPLSL
ncbi:MAG: primosomal protein N' [Burkholderiales bacterium]